MEELDGSNIIETFNLLGINTLNVNDLTIKAWSDTDCEDMRQLLNWLCQLGQENVLTPLEEEEYEQLSQSGMMLVGKEYDSALTQIQADYAGILDYESNTFEVRRMEDEVEILKQHKQHLDEALNINSNVKKKLQRELHRNAEKELARETEKEAAQERCLEMSRKLDEIRVKLQHQICRYAMHLSQFENETKSTFVTSIPVENYEHHYRDVTNHLNLVLNHEYGLLPKLETTIGSARKKLLDTSTSSTVEDRLDVLQQRIFESMRSYVYKQAEAERLSCEVDFLEGLNLENFFYKSLDDSDSISTEARIFIKDERFEAVLVDLEEMIRHKCSTLIDQPKICRLENLIFHTQKKIETLTLLDGKAAKLLATQTLMLMLMKKGNEDVQSMDKYFRDVYHYITHKVYDSLTRINHMTEIIDEYKTYKTQSIEERFKIVGVIKDLLKDENENFSTAVETVSNFKSKLHKLEHEVFVSDHEQQRKNFKNIESEIAIMKKFLLSGPTKRLVAIPQPIAECFSRLDEIVERQNTSVKAAMTVLTDTKNQISGNKWLKMKRLLWKKFLFEPKKVLEAIEQIKAAVQQQRNKALSAMS